VDIVIVQFIVGFVRLFWIIRLGRQLSLYLATNPEFCVVVIISSTVYWICFKLSPKTTFCVPVILSSFGVGWI
jgi:hypothetical protein